MSLPENKCRADLFCKSAAFPCQGGESRGPAKQVALRLLRRCGPFRERIGRDEPGAAVEQGAGAVAEGVYGLSGGEEVEGKGFRLAARTRVLPARMLKSISGSGSIFSPGFTCATH